MFPFAPKAPLCPVNRNGGEGLDVDPRRQQGNPPCRVRTAERARARVFMPEGTVDFVLFIQPSVELGVL